MKLIQVYFTTILFMPFYANSVELPHSFRMEGASRDCARSESKVENHCKKRGGTCYNITSSRASGNAANAFQGQVVVGGQVQMIDSNQETVNQERSRVQSEGYICKAFEASTRECLKWNEGARCVRVGERSTWSLCYCMGKRPSNAQLGTEALNVLHQGTTEIPLPRASSVNTTEPDPSISVD